MANTKSSVVREIIIDRLLQDRRGHSVKEILKVVNHNFIADGLNPVSINTIRNDIERIRYLYRVRLNVEKRGYREYFSYADPNLTIFKNVITFGEFRHLRSAVQSIRFMDEEQGALMYEDLTKRLSELLNIDTADDPILIYSEVPNKKERNTFKTLYDLIHMKVPTVISYIPTPSGKEQKILVHPYFMRKRKQRWSLLCHDATNDQPAEIPISHITRTEQCNDVEFLPNHDFEFKDYYKKLKVENKNDD
jgi:hypothetical protein